MATITRELSDAIPTVLRMYALSRNPLLENPISIRPHMHCGTGSRRLFPMVRSPNASFTS